MDSTPSAKNKTLCNSVLRISQAVGANQPAGEMFPLRIKLIAFYLLFALVMQIHSLNYHWNNLLKICNIAITYVLALQLVAKALSRTVKNDEKLLPEINKIIDNFYKTHEKDEKFQQTLDNYIKIFNFVTRSQIIIMFFIFHIPPFISWMTTLITGEYVMIVHVFLPYTDPQTLFGYLLNQTYMTFLCTILFIFLSSGELYFLYVTLHVIPMVEILILKLERFAINLDEFEVKGLKTNTKCSQLASEAKIVDNQEVSSQKFNKFDQSCSNLKIDQKDSQQNINFNPNSRQDELQINSTHQNCKDYQLKILKTPKTQNQPQNSSSTFKPTSKEQLILIIQDYNIYNSYIAKILNFMEMATFMTCTLSQIGIGLSLLIITTDDNTLGISTFVLFTLQVFMQCVEGSIVMHQNKKFLNRVCGFPWYKLSIEDKKIFLQFIHACQNTNNFSVPIIGHLNMELFADVANGSYSFLMFVLQFVKVGK